MRRGVSDTRLWLAGAGRAILPLESARVFVRLIGSPNSLGLAGQVCEIQLWRSAYPQVTEPRDTITCEFASCFRSTRKSYNINVERSQRWYVRGLEY